VPGGHRNVVGFDYLEFTITPRLGTTEEWLELRSRVNPVSTPGYVKPGNGPHRGEISTELRRWNGVGHANDHPVVAGWSFWDACYQRWGICTVVAPSATRGHDARRGLWPAAGPTLQT